MTNDSCAKVCFQLSSRNKKNSAQHFVSAPKTQVHCVRVRMQHPAHHYGGVSFVRLQNLRSERKPTRVLAPLFFQKWAQKLGPQMTERAQCSESGTIVKMRNMQNFSRVICQNSVLCVCAMKRKIMWDFFNNQPNSHTTHQHTQDYS